MTLGDLEVGARGTILKVLSPHGDAGLLLRLMQLGFLEGSSVEVVQQAPYFSDPIAVRVRGALIALRREEARAIVIERETT